MTKSSFGKTLKLSDAFKIPVEMFIHRSNLKTGTHDEYYRFGTKCGGCVTIILYMSLFGYFVSQWVLMYSTSQDFIQK